MSLHLRHMINTHNQSQSILGRATAWQQGTASFHWHQAISMSPKIVSRGQTRTVSCCFEATYGLWLGDHSHTIARQHCAIVEHLGELRPDYQHRTQVVPWGPKCFRSPAGIIPSPPVCALTSSPPNYSLDRNHAKWQPASVVVVGCEKGKETCCCCVLLLGVVGRGL